MPRRSGGSSAGGVLRSNAPWPALPRRPLPAVQIHNRYLVTESAEGVLVIDQHALHERILYEQLRAKVLAGALETQHLLVPEPRRSQRQPRRRWCWSTASCWRSWACDVEPFGGDTVLVSSYPAMLSARSPSEVLRDLVDQLLRGGRRPSAATCWTSYCT